MLKKLKSIFFLKKIFSYISENVLLNLVAYNKDLQKKLDKSLINYKLMSGKYIIHETNNKAKIYSAYNDELIIECEYLNGKKNGKCKEYDYNGTLRFEIEYLNGEKNGKYKKYDEEGNLIVKAEYLNGKSNGRYKEYYRNGKLRMENEYVNGKFMNVLYYDKYSGIINELHDGNGFIKEKNQEGQISFKVEYANGIIRKITGYYDNGKLKVEEYYNEGNKINKIKEYYKNGQLKSDIEFFNELKWNIKVYDQNNNIINNLKEGKGYIKEYNHKGDVIFVGEY